MLERDGLEKQVFAKRAQLERLAVVDRQFSIDNDIDALLVISVRSGRIMAELHRRGGTQVGFRTPARGVILAGKKDIVYLYDEDGKLAERFIMRNPPAGYMPLTQPELQREVFRRASVPLAETMGN